MSKSTQLSTVALSDDQQRQMGEQLTAQYHRAQSAQLEIITFGAMCIEIEAVSVGGKCATNQPQGGRYLAGSGLKPWLQKYAPKVEYTKARRYRDIAEALVGELHLQSVDQLKLLTAADGKLDKKLAKKRETLLDLVNGQSVRGLQLELGLTDPAPARGGARAKKTGADEPKSPAEAPDWCTEPERAIWATLTTPQQQAAFIDWRPRIRLMGDQLHDQANSLLPHLDEQTRTDLISIAQDLLSHLSPGLLRRSA